MTQKKEALLMINVPIDEDRVEWMGERVKDTFKKLFTVDKQKRILNKVNDAVKKWMATDSTVKKYTDQVMQVYVENYYSRIWPQIRRLEGVYNDGEYYEFLMEVAALYNSTVLPLLNSAETGLNTVSEWIEKAQKEAYNHFANEYGLEAQQEEQKPATASVGHRIAALDPSINFQVRTALFPLFPFPIMMPIDKDDPDEVRRWKTFAPSISPVVVRIYDAIKKRSKKRKEKKQERIREQDVVYLANKWARKSVNEHATTKSLAAGVKKSFVDPLRAGKKNLKKARYDYSKGELYNAVRDVAVAYQQTFVPLTQQFSRLTEAMNNASALYEAHMKHFSDYVAKGGELPKTASAQNSDHLRIGDCIYRQVDTE